MECGDASRRFPLRQRQLPQLALRQSKAATGVAALHIIPLMKNFEITCPCCEATIVVDRISGEVLLHKAKEVRGPGGSLDAMVAGLETQKSEAARRFDRQMESQKDRARILEEKFKAALEQAEKSDEKYVNPMDID
jgi:hypothetical protein